MISTKKYILPSYERAGGKKKRKENEKEEGKDEKRKKKGKIGKKNTFFPRLQKGKKLLRSQQIM